MLCCRCLTCINRINPHNNARRKVLYFLTTPPLLASYLGKEMWVETLDFSSVHPLVSTLCPALFSPPLCFYILLSPWVSSWVQSNRKPQLKTWERTISSPASFSVEAWLTDCIPQPEVMVPFSLDWSLCLQVNASSPFRVVKEASQNLSWGTAQPLGTFFLLTRML